MWIWMSIVTVLLVFLIVVGLWQLKAGSGNLTRARQFKPISDCSGPAFRHAVNDRFAELFARVQRLEKQHDASQNRPKTIDIRKTDGSTDSIAEHA